MNLVDNAAKKRTSEKTEGEKILKLQLSTKKADSIETVCPGSTLLTDRLDLDVADSSMRPVSASPFDLLE